ncbi:MAG: phosphoserine phosphatase SerB [Burkholderiales bacterium]|nr:MAG: phosphoserine phosphatase SerB [Betaproteobacteria bacterium]TAG28929.1 MAG: phosphoserine phosphatase SerB [Burkholderiales bacterium]
MTDSTENRLPAHRAIAIRELGLLAMDMDSTAITIECIDEIADFAGVKAEVSAITERAMRGELEFRESLRRRVACLEGLSTQVLAEVYEARLRPSEGLAELMQHAQANGVKTLLVSGGFTYFTERMRQRFGYTYTRANTLGEHDGRLTGKVCGAIVDSSEKERLLLSLMATLPSTRQKSMAIGDGANDLPMLKAATLGVAFHAKPTVREQVPVAINRGGLAQLIALLPE